MAELNEAQLKVYERLFSYPEPPPLTKVDRRELLQLIADYRRRGDRIRELEDTLADAGLRESCLECFEFIEDCTCPPDDTAAQLRHEQFDDMKGANL